MRILILSQWFDPEPHFKGMAFARELVERGHQVQVLTGFPNYPGGKLYPGFRIRPFSRQQIDGVSVIRVALFPSHDRSSLKRILTYLSFALSAAIFGPFLVSKVDVAYVYHPPPTVGIAAIILRFLRGFRFVYEIQDLWPDTLEATGMIRNKTALAVVGCWCSLVYRFASAIVVISPGFKERLVAQGVPDEKVQVIYNWAPDEPSEGAVDNAPLTKFSLPRNRFNVLYAGNIGLAQALDFIPAAAELLQRDAPEVQLVFIGSGVAFDNLKDGVAARKLQNVLFMPRVSPAEARRLQQQADALLIHLRKDPLFTITIPSKTQAYLAAGRPILMGVEGDAAALVARAKAGIPFEPENPESLAAAVAELLRLPAVEKDAMGNRGRMFYRSHLARSIAVSEFESVFLEVARVSERQTN